MSKDPYKMTAKFYDRLFGPFNGALRSIGLKIYPPREGMKVLDVGCGTGAHLELYREAGCVVFGIDRSPAMLHRARRRLGDASHLDLGDASRMPYHDGEFDLVVMSMALHEMPPSMRGDVIGEIKRVLKEDGRILFIDYHRIHLRTGKGWLSRAAIHFVEFLAGRNHFRNYRSFLAHNGLSGLIEAHGLSVEKRKIVSGGNLALLLCRRKIRRLHRPVP